jgi:hypothetical protein
MVIKIAPDDVQQLLTEARAPIPPSENRAHIAAGIARIAELYDAFKSRKLAVCIISPPRSPTKKNFLRLTEEYRGIISSAMEYTIGKPEVQHRFWDAAMRADEALAEVAARYPDIGSRRLRRDSISWHYFATEIAHLYFSQVDSTAGWSAKGPAVRFTAAAFNRISGRKAEQQAAVERGVRYLVRRRGGCGRSSQSRCLWWPEPIFCATHSAITRGRTTNKAPP